MSVAPIEDLWPSVVDDARLWDDAPATKRKARVRKEKVPKAPRAKKAKKPKKPYEWKLPKVEYTVRWVPMPKPEYVNSREEAAEIASYLRTKPMVAVDTETTGLNVTTDKVVIWSISDGERRWCLPVRLLSEFHDLLADPTIVKCFWNAKFDLHMLHNMGCRVKPPIYDGRVMAWLLDENATGRLGLKDFNEDYGDIHLLGFKDVFGLKEKSQQGDVVAAAMDDPERRDAAIDYASADAYMTYYHVSELKKALADAPVPGPQKGGWTTLLEYFELVESTYTNILWKMERRGIQIDTEYLVSIEPAMRDEIDRIQGEFNREAGREVSLSSVPQLRDFFYNVLRMPELKTTKGGEASTDEEVLLRFEEEYDCKFSKLLLKHRTYSKVLGTYVAGLLKRVGYVFNADERRWVRGPDYVDGRIHTTFNQDRVVTGRLSSSDPNL